MKCKSLAIAVAAACLMTSSLSYASTPCSDDSSNCLTVHGSDSVSKEELIKISDNHYIFQYEQEGRKVSVTGKKSGDVVYTEVIVDGNITAAYEYLASADGLGPTRRVRRNTEDCSGDSTWMPSGSFEWDFVKYVNPRNSTYGHPDKEFYDIPIFDDYVRNGHKYIHFQLSKTASGILTQAPAWMIGTVLGGVVTSAAGAVIGSFIAPPVGTAVGGAAGLVLGGAGGALFAVVTGEIANEKLRDEDGNVWMVIDKGAFVDLEMVTESGWLVDTHYFRGTAHYKYISIGQYCSQNLDVEVNIPYDASLSL